MKSPRARAYGPSVELLTIDHVAEENIPPPPPLPPESPEPPPEDAPPEKRGPPISAKLSAFKSLDAEAALRTLPHTLQQNLASMMGRLTDLFRAIDADGNGWISKKEFVGALSSLGLEASKREFEKVFDSFDKDGSGTVEYTEFEKVIRKGDTIHGVRGEKKKHKEKPKTNNEKVRFDPSDAIGGGPDGMPKSAAAFCAPFRPVAIRHNVLRSGGDATAPPLNGWERIVEGHPGRNRGSGQLILVAIPAATHRTPLPADGFGAVVTPRFLTPAPSYMPSHFPHGVLKSGLLTSLTTSGFSILAYEPSFIPPDGDEEAWSAQAGDAAVADLLAALEYVGGHRSLRYSRISLLLSGVHASASLAALSGCPQAFELRVKAIVLATPAPVDGLLEICVPRCPRVPTLLLAPMAAPPARRRIDVDGSAADAEEAPSDGGKFEFAKAMHVALRAKGTPCDVIAGGFDAPPPALFNFLGTYGQAMPPLVSPRSGKGSPRRTPRGAVNGSPRLPQIA